MERRCELCRGRIGNLRSPLVLDCGHSYHGICLAYYFFRGRRRYECPVCRARLSRRDRRFFRLAVDGLFAPRDDESEDSGYASG